MIHLFAHKKGRLKGKYDIALVVRGKYIVGSNQGYSKKQSAIKAAFSFLHIVDGLNVHLEVIPTPFLYTMLQDNTLPTPKLLILWEGSKHPIYSTKKPHKPYQPK